MAEPDVTEAWSRLRAILDVEGWDEAAAREQMSVLVSASTSAAPADRMKLADVMGRYLRDAPVRAAGLAALTGGALVEHGGPVTPLSDAIFERLPGILAAAERFVVAAHEAFPDPPEPPDEPPPGSLPVGADLLLPPEWVAERARIDLEAVVKFLVLDHWCYALIAMATRERSVLEWLVTHGGLRDALQPLADASGGAHWLWNLCLVPLREPLVFVDLPSLRVFDLEMDGVASNFELHSLLDAALAGPLGHPRPPAEVLDCLAGRGEQTRDVGSVGRWNLYSWRVARLAEGGTDGPSAHWVWGEGRPADIPRFDALRVVLGGAPSYSRSWTTQRSYGALAPRITLVRERSQADARAFVEALRARAPELPAPAVSRGSSPAPVSWLDRLKARLGLGPKR